MKESWLGSFEKVEDIGGRGWREHLDVHPEDLKRLQGMRCDESGVDIKVPSII